MGLPEAACLSSPNFAIAIAAPENSTPASLSDSLQPLSSSRSFALPFVVLDCNQSNYQQNSPLPSPNSVMDFGFFPEGEEDCPQTPKGNMIAPALRCPGAPLKKKPAMKRRMKGADVRVLAGGLEPLLKVDAKRRGRRRLWAAQALLEGALRS